MPIIFQKLITVEDCRANKNTLYVFGDNLQRWGRAGQAIIRDENNAIGLPTKREPKNTPNAFLTDNDISAIEIASQRDRKRLIDFVQNGKIVIWPLDGIGTGRAALQHHAPKVAEYWEEFKQLLIRA